jgi:tRNA dimethylallyltransferase
MPSIAPSTIEAPVLVLVGPTAIGKTALSLELAERVHCEIVSMDSMQVYRYMDIGTAKASSEERRRVPHHLIDVVDPDEQYDAARFVQDAKNAIASIHTQGKIPLITGGTGLYLSSLFSGLFETIKVPNDIRIRLMQRLNEEGRVALYAELCTVDPASGQRIHINDTQRLVRALEIYQATGLPWSEHLHRQQRSVRPSCYAHALLLGLTCDRNQLYERIHRRSVMMMGDAFAEEVSWLLAQGYSPSLPSMQSIGYRHMLGCLAGNWDRESATATLVRDTRRYAKRQLTWFRHQQQIQWFPVDARGEIFTAIESFLRQTSSEQIT